VNLNLFHIHLHQYESSRGGIDDVSYARQVMLMLNGMCDEDISCLDNICVEVIV
jgi:hypothetical protein